MEDARGGQCYSRMVSEEIKVHGRRERGGVIENMCRKSQ